MDRWTDKMDENISYKDFFEKLDSIHKDITDIKIQTTRTNGRVTYCESAILDHTKEIKTLKDYNSNQDKEINKLIWKVGVIVTVISFIIYQLTGFLVSI